MRQSSIAFCVLLIAGLLAIPALAGFSGGDGSSSAAATIAKSGVLGGFGEQLKREDDEQAVKERVESEPQTPEERAEAHEDREVAAIEAAHHDESEGDSEAAQLAVQGSEGENEAESSSEAETESAPTLAASGENGAS